MEADQICFGVAGAVDQELATVRCDRTPPVDRCGATWPSSANDDK
jgi:hypothetical protein